MTPIQERLFEMLCEVVAICEEHAITYYAAGGTALGAVRHKGFIPWDDDVDLMMPREDWKRFIEVARQGLPPGRRLCCLELDEEYPHVFGRYVDTTSTSIHYNQFLGGTPEGFVIDIFVLDPIRDSGPAFERHREALSLYNDLANPLGYSYPLSSDPARIADYTKRMEQEGRRAVLEELEADLCSCELEDASHLVMRWACAPRLFKKEFFAYRRFEDFEGLRIQVPSQCADYLVHHYGDDWAYLPQRSNRVVHDAITFVDVDYQTVQSDYLPFVDVERTKKAILARRQAHIRDMGKIDHASDLRARIASVFARQVTMRRACEVDVGRLVENHETEELDRVFAMFYRWQCDALLEGREEYLKLRRYYDPVYIDIGDDLLAFALENLIDTNRVSKAARILRIRELEEAPLDDSVMKAKALLEAVRMPASLNDVGLADAAYDFACDILELRPQNYSMRLFVLDRLSEQGRTGEMEALAQDGLKYFPMSGEFLKYETDVRSASASSEEDKHASAESYTRAIKRTTNAFIVESACERLHELEGDDHPTPTGSGESKADESIQAVPAMVPLYDRELVRRKVFRLLCELDEICNANGIDHYLGPLSCKLSIVHGGNKPALPQLDMMVPASQMPELAKVLCAMQSDTRACDCWLTNPRYLSFALDYVDTTSTFLQMEEGTNIQEHGLKVNVLPLREADARKQGVGAMRGKLLDAIESGWEINGYNLTRRITAKRALRAAGTRFLMLGGRKRLARTLFGFMSEEAQGEPELRALRYYDSKPLSADAAHFQAGSSMLFEGREFPVPKDLEDLMTNWFGIGWEDDVRTWSAPVDDVFIDPDLPYKLLLQHLESQGCHPRELFKEMRALRIGMLGQVRNLRLRNQAIALAERTRDRKEIYDALHLRDGEIASCRASGDFDRLKVLFADYDRLARAYLRKDLGLCPCKEHMDVLCELWVHEGYDDLAKELKRLAPDKHYSPLM